MVGVCVASVVLAVVVVTAVLNIAGGGYWQSNVGLCVEEEGRDDDDDDDGDIYFSIVAWEESSRVVPHSCHRVVVFRRQCRNKGSKDESCLSTGLWAQQK